MLVRPLISDNLFKIGMHQELDEMQERDPPFKTSVFLGGEGSKLCQICQRRVVKNCRREGGRVKNRENLPTS